MNETYTRLAHLLQVNEGPAYAPARGGDVRDSLADIAAAQSAFGYKVQVDFEEGLRRTVAWYRDREHGAEGVA